jgi:hypothetical protein
MESDREPDVLKRVLERPSRQVLAQPIPARPARISGTSWACSARVGDPQVWVPPVREEPAQGILIEALGMLATHFGSEKADDRDLQHQERHSPATEPS